MFWWLCASLIFAAICGILGLQQAFRFEYVVQDDARQHVFWMQRFTDPELFPHDLIADYFQSVAPYGYAAFYRVMAKVGIHPLLFHKILPMVLGLIATGYCFGLCLEILPVPPAAFVATVLLNQSLWIKFDLVSATPRAFLYPLLLAFFYYLLRRSLLPCLVTIALQGLFYPHTVLICAGVLVLRLLRWERGRPRFSPERSDYLFCLMGLGVALVAMLPFILKSSEFGPAITVAEARRLPEFRPGGRSPFFYRHFGRYWLTGRLSGMFPPAIFTHKLLFLAGALPILLAFPSRFPLLKQTTPGIKLLPQIILSSLAAFFAAHALLFRLHLPSRYTQHTLRIVMALAAGITLIAIGDALFRWAAGRSRFPQRFLALGFSVLLGVVLIAYPASLKRFPRTNYVVGKHPSLYHFISRQPKDILIASLAEEVNNLPAFSQRSVLVGREFAIPYHSGYYLQFRERVIDLIRAQYTPDRKELQHFIRKYGVDLWLLERDAFHPRYFALNKWMKQFQPEADEAEKRLKRGVTPALADFAKRCSVMADKRFVVLDAGCIERSTGQ